MERQKSLMVKKIDLYNFYKKKKILITGHTGFKGSWLSAWFLKIGCKVVGVSKDIPTKPSNFLILNLNNKVKNYYKDVTNFISIKNIILKEKPDLIFHFAAKSIVSESYKKPLETINTNTIGSINVLHSASLLKKRCICIMITSDKCYFNKEKKTGYIEESLLGGKDIYSGSKAAAEILLNSYYHSFKVKNKKLLFCTARAGNVIGGGDWSKDRLVPDIMKSWAKGKKAQIKNPKSIRPWQHVLEPLFGYMKMGIILSSKEKLNGQSFNFGPSKRKIYKVIDLVRKLESSMNLKKRYTIKKNIHFKETKILKLNSLKAKKILNWQAYLNLQEMVTYISTWYLNYFKKDTNMYKFTLSQIQDYENKI